jgi:pimeloyl-ACP methyl ester carboxylesterase
MSLSVACADDAWAINPDSIRKANAVLDPAFQKLAERNVEEIQKICRLWDVNPSDAKQHQALKTKLPVLILAGEQDPITPPAWGKLLHDSIPGSYLYLFPGTAHGVFTTQPDPHVCAESLILDFMEDSSQPPDGHCVSKLEHLPFRVPSQ